MSEHSPHYWGFATQKKWDDWRDAVSRQYRDEFYLDLANYLRGRSHTIKPGTEGETMATIVRRLIDQMDLERKDEFLSAVDCDSKLAARLLCRVRNALVGSHLSRRGRL